MSNTEATVSYDDGSGAYGGGTGNFADPARTVWYTLNKTPNDGHQADWIIW